MPGTRPGMTSFEESAQYHWLHFESDSQDEATDHHDLDQPVDFRLR